MEGDKAGVDNDVEDVDPALFGEDQCNAKPSERCHGDPIVEPHPDSRGREIGPIELQLSKRGKEGAQVGEGTIQISAGTHAVSFAHAARARHRIFSSELSG